MVTKRVKYKEPESYFSPAMREAEREWDEEQKKKEIEKVNEEYISYMAKTGGKNKKIADKKRAEALKAIEEKYK